MFGLAIFVTISQLPKLFGLDKGEGDSIRQLGYVIAHLGDTSLVTLLVGVAALAALFALERCAPRLPGASPSTRGAFEDLDRHPDAIPVPGVLIVRPDSPVFYANAQSVQDGVEAMVAEGDGVSAVLVDLDASEELDITSVEALEKLVTNLQRQGMRVGFVHLHGPALDLARRSGLLDRLGGANVLATVDAGVEWAQATTADGGTSS